MSHEQLTSAAPTAAQADLWALAACAFHAMTGRSPFAGDSVGEIAWRVCVGPLPVPSKLRPDAPPGFDAWFARACSREIADRPQTAYDLARTLAIACSDSATPTTPTPPP